LIPILTHKANVLPMGSVLSPLFFDDAAAREPAGCSHWYRGGDISSLLATVVSASEICGLDITILELFNLPFVLNEFMAKAKKLVDV